LSSLSSTVQAEQIRTTDRRHKVGVFPIQIKSVCFLEELAGNGSWLLRLIGRGKLSHLMDAPSPSVRKLARRLLTLEATSESASSDARVHEAVRVWYKLRVSLTRFAGSDSFASLLRRALALARAEIPSLKQVKIGPDCSIEGLEALSRNDATEAAAALTAHLLGLLITFIGQPLTLRLVREASPDASLDE